MMMLTDACSASSAYACLIVHRTAGRPRESHRSETRTPGRRHSPRDPCQLWKTMGKSHSLRCEIPGGSFSPVSPHSAVGAQGQGSPSPPCPRLHSAVGAGPFPSLSLPLPPKRGGKRAEGKSGGDRWKVGGKGGGGTGKGMRWERLGFYFSGHCSGHCTPHPSSPPTPSPLLRPPQAAVVVHSPPSAEPSEPSALGERERPIDKATQTATALPPPPPPHEDMANDDQHPLTVIDVEVGGGCETCH